jgi:phosphoenolpyruvate-protein phosphotransferase
MGRAVSFGHAVGPAFILKKQSSTVPEFKISEKQIPQEWLRFERACGEAERQLMECKAQISGGTEVGRGEIFDIQIALLKDSYILHELKRMLQHSLKNIEACLVAVVDKCVQQFREKELLSVHGHYWDLQDVSKRLLRILAGESVCESNTITKGSVCIAKDLEPSDVIALKNAEIAGILLESDCATSHAVILAKSLRVPILIGVQEACSRIKEGARVEIDSEMGACWINKKVANASVVQELTLPEEIFIEKQKVHFYLSYDGCESPLLKAPAISGIGLVRTETLFFNREDFPDEEEQFLFYKRIVESANGKPVVLRTLDIGGDKLPKGEYLQELNPFLGLRGIRYCLKHEDVFRQQLVAMLRASAFGCVKILYPMISDVNELIRANEILDTCKQVLSGKDIRFSSDIEIGAMLETPSAVFCINDLAKHCDFFSIGTNDLIQYTLAVDRTNPAVASLYQMTHPSVFRCMQLIAQQANELNKEVLICGELPNAVIPFLMCLSLGYRSFVAYDNSIPYLARLCNKVNLDELRTLATGSRHASSSDALFSIFEKFYEKFLNETKIS